MNVSRLRSQLYDHVRASSIASIVVAVKACAGETWEYCKGYSDANSRVPMKAGDRFLIYSLTKTFIAAAVLKLADTRLIDLDAPFASYLSNVPYSSEFSTRQLLNHTSGVPDYGVLPEYHAVVKQRGVHPWSFQEFIERTLLKGLSFEPGKGWAYSNIGYMLLSRLIEEVTRQELGSAMTSLIFRPLALDQTFFMTRREQMYELVAGQSFNVAGQSFNLSIADGVADARGFYDPGWVAHGVIASTAKDVATFYHELLKGRLLSAATLEQMRKLIDVKSSHPPFVRPSYGLGLMADPEYLLGAIYGHTGEGPGYCGAAYHLCPNEGLAITVSALCNSEEAKAVEVLVLDLLEMAYVKF